MVLRKNKMYSIINLLANSGLDQDYFNLIEDIYINL